MPEGRELTPAEQLRKGMLGSLENKGEPPAERPSAEKSHDIGLMASHGDPEMIRKEDSETDPFFKGRKRAIAALNAANELAQIAPHITDPEL